MGGRGSMRAERIRHGSKHVSSEGSLAVLMHEAAEESWRV